jgi:hypothetical protein
MNNLEKASILWLAIASLMGLIGTNQQARLARQRLLNDPDDAIMRAGRLWQPGLTRKRTKRQQEAIEAEFRDDAERWAKYQSLRGELAAWNWLESAVAMAVGGSALALVGAYT